MDLDIITTAGHFNREKGKNWHLISVGHGQDFPASPYKIYLTFFFLFSIKVCNSIRSENVFLVIIL